MTRDQLDQDVYNLLEQLKATRQVVVADYELIRDRVPGLLESIVLLNRLHVEVLTVVLTQLELLKRRQTNVANDGGAHAAQPDRQ